MRPEMKTGQVVFAESASWRVWGYNTVRDGDGNSPAKNEVQRENNPPDNIR